MKPFLASDASPVTKTLCSLSWIRLKSWPRPRDDGRQLNVVDLFCGCGGLSLGAFEAARTNDRTLQIALALDIDQAALGVYRSNFEVNERIARDTDVAALFSARGRSPLSSQEQALRREVGNVDLILAGPPCQGHSDLNNSSRRCDPRNSLYLRVARAARVLEPKAVLIENVPSVIHDKGRVVARATNELRLLGYKVAAQVVSADSLGVPQTRKRHILVATQQSEFDFNGLLQSHGTERATVRDYIGDLADLNGESQPLFDEASKMSEENRSRAEYLYRNASFDLPDHLRPRCHRDFKHSYVSMYGRLRWDQPAQTITSGFGSMGQGRFLHPSRCRTVTPHEAARLQGFPDFFRFEAIKSRTLLQTTIGNAVPPKLAAVVVDQLIRSAEI